MTQLYSKKDKWPCHWCSVEDWSWLDWRPIEWRVQTGDWMQSKKIFYFIENKERKVSNRDLLSVMVQCGAGLVAGSLGAGDEVTLPPPQSSSLTAQLSHMTFSSRSVQTADSWSPVVTELTSHTQQCSLFLACRLAGQQSWQPTSPGYGGNQKALYCIFIILKNWILFYFIDIDIGLWKSDKHYIFC